MDKEKAEQLKERRLLFQEELQLKEIRKRILHQLDYLDENQFEYQIYDSGECLNWINSNVQVRNRDGYRGCHGDFQIDVDTTLGINEYVKYSQIDVLSDKIREQVSTMLPKEGLLIICRDGGDPELEITVEAFLSQPLLFFDKMETWILAKDHSWIIELIDEQDVIRFIQLQGRKPTLVKNIYLQN
jgi:hypothetical protein